MSKVSDKRTLSIARRRDIAEFRLLQPKDADQPIMKQPNNHGGTGKRRSRAIWYIFVTYDGVYMYLEKRENE
jgi:hypothetical protein